jgi:hypothetical protein
MLPGMVRTALLADDVPLAERLVESVEPRYALDEHVLRAAQAQRAEHAGYFRRSRRPPPRTRRGWQSFGNVLERGRALLGFGRCRLAAGLPGAEEPLQEARKLFDSMGFTPAAAEAATLVEQAAAAPAS